MASRPRPNVQPPTAAEFAVALSAWEGQFVEFKESVGDSLARELVAFANSGGGRIYIGVADDKKVQGITVNNRLLSQVQDIARNCDPPVAVNLVPFRYQGHDLLMVEVIEGDQKPYGCSAGYFLRTGPNSQKMNRSELIRFLRGFREVRFDELPCEACHYPADFSDSAFRTFLSEAKITAKNVSREDLLVNLGLAMRHGNALILNNAGVLFFAKNPRRFHLQSRITCLLFHGTQKIHILDRKDFDGRIADNVESALTFLQRHIPIRYEIIGMNRREITAIPDSATREALLNAVIHRDYFERGGVVMVELFQDRLQVTNPGGLLPGFRLDDLGRFSLPRNPLIADLFLRMGYVERGMNISMGISGLLGRRVHIAGSASPQTDTRLMCYAHELVSRVVRGILQAGGGLVLGVGKEPRAENTLPNAPSLIFDWTALETTADYLRRGPCAWPSASGPPLVVVSSEKAEKEIPEERRPLWEELLGSGCVRLESIRPGARSATMIRERQAQFGSILLILGGGTGVEHLADLYMGRRRPVIPLDLLLGASRADGTGGSEHLAREARAEPHRFFALPALLSENANARLASLATRGGARDVVQVADNALALLMALSPPKAFYVRLLNRKHSAFAHVEGFFRGVVDSVVAAAGFERIEMGTDITEHAFINVGIFESLHFASVVVVDVTGGRPNCFIELGYALGHGLRVIVTAEEGTSLPFDQDAIPCYFWTHGINNQERQAELTEFWRKNVDRPPLVR